MSLIVDFLPVSIAPSQCETRCPPPHKPMFVDDCWCCGHRTSSEERLPLPLIVGFVCADCVYPGQLNDFIESASDEIDRVNAVLVSRF